MQASLLIKLIHNIFPFDFLHTRFGMLFSFHIVEWHTNKYLVTLTRR